ncbi:MAG TPA: hypothetical protein VNS63_12440 [Blastocatellia bacterium]|nr:hypothetical protein [Blastocatellia bacterium]
MSTKYESMNGIMKLYELRREETMRQARDWFVKFHPGSLQDILDAFAGEHSAYFRMVTTYWDMAASFVNHGAIDEQMFNDANVEHVAVFAKVEPFLNEIRGMANAPRYLANLEELVMRLPNAKERLVEIREQLKVMSAARGEASRSAK